MHAFWYLFLSFFWDIFFALLVPFFKRCNMLSHFLSFYNNEFCYISIRICTRVEKFLRNGHKKYVQKSIPRNLFVKIRRAHYTFVFLFLQIHMHHIHRRLLDFLDLRILFFLHLVFL